MFESGLCQTNFSNFVYSLDRHREGKKTYPPNTVIQIKISHEIKF